MSVHCRLLVWASGHLLCHLTYVSVYVHRAMKGYVGQGIYHKHTLLNLRFLDKMPPQPPWQICLLKLYVVASYLVFIIHRKEWCLEFIIYRVGGLYFKSEFHLNKPVRKVMNYVVFSPNMKDVNELIASVKIAIKREENRHHKNIFKKHTCSDEIHMVYHFRNITFPKQAKPHLYTWYEKVLKWKKIYQYQ